MKRTKAANIIFILCFLGFLYAGMAVTIFKPKETTSIFENRTLASVPVLQRDTFLDGSWFADWETYLKDHAAGRNTLLKAGTYIDLYVLNRPVVNETFVSGPYLLAYNRYETVDPVELAEQSAQSADSLSGLQKHVQENGGVFYYVAVSGQMAYDRAAYPAYLNSRSEYFDTVLSLFKADMAERSVNLIDMGDAFEQMGHPENVYYGSDHHLTFDGALLTYRTIMTRLNADCLLSLPVLSDADMTVQTLDNPFLGSRMRKLFRLIPTADQFKTHILNQEIPFTRTDNGVPGPQQVYNLPQNEWETVSYLACMGGDIGETVIQTNRPALPNVLIVGDSYTNAVECFLYTSFNEMRSLDLRWYTAQTLSDYIAAYQPDVVILLRDYSVLLSTDGNGDWQHITQQN